ncbi:malonate transporter subunit MadM [candidate division KSB1 bacterium]
MKTFIDLCSQVLIKNGLITAFTLVGIVILLSYFLSNKFTKGRLHGSAIAITIGLLLACIGGVITGGQKGIADISLFAGIGLMGGSMLRDLAIVSTAFGAGLKELKKSGLAGILSLFLGVIISFIVGAVTALAFGYTDPVDVTTIGAGAVTYIVGPVTGTALGAGSEIIALSIAAGLVKSILVMLGTPLVARYIGLNNPQSAVIYGGLMGTTSGVAAGIGAVDPKLVPYGAMPATFYTGLGCLAVPSLFFLIMRGLLG